MKKKFSSNEAYFKWFNKNLGRVSILRLIVKDDIVVYYKMGANLC
mgnify:CR=1 FL=1